MEYEKNVKPCPYNEGAGCETPNCERCGWYPPVAKERRRMILGENKLFKVPFTGYCEVWAINAEDAAEKAEDVAQQFFAHYDYGEPECLEKEEENELD